MFRLHLKKTFCKAIFYCILEAIVIFISGCVLEHHFSLIYWFCDCLTCVFFFPVLRAFLVNWLAPHGATSIGNMHGSVLDF